MNMGLGVLLLLAVAACTQYVVPSQSMAGTAPILSVERFLQAANAGDLDAMGRIFGTPDGAILERTGNPVTCAFRRVGSWFRLGSRCPNRQEVELRMNAIAMILRHSSYQIRGEGEVPGRMQPATRVMVDITQGSQVARDVPFVTVQTRDGRWMVEEIGLERVTSR